MLQTRENASYGYRNNYNTYDINRKKQPNQASGKGKLILVYVFFLILISIIVVSYIGQSVKITHLNYKINDLSEKLTKIENENHKLNLKLARNSSLAKIENIARNQLNMIEPDKMEVIVLNNKPDNVKQSENIDKEGQKMFVFQMFDNLMERLTVKAVSLE